jgi:hypothetical protein
MKKHGWASPIDRYISPLAVTWSKSTGLPAAAAWEIRICHRPAPIMATSTRPERARNTSVTCPSRFASAIPVRRASCGAMLRPLVPASISIVLSPPREPLWWITWP